ncbi:class I SAM-dependent methyltransferase [Hyphococcus flavus]|uniref:Class I SAM-dependent methyltransferase n=1 Tax=Hyphococcus flavus TaxID=1866326 RepID=A0AAF0CIC3_9PROT|nr:class I SAM-dependent methyltransferase [Hyphococcus flavus]WDI32727.1 class I SAM-dependent methyltransferase [Hyphococcus flavus]
MSKSYENLPGASGKAKFFRPSRYEAAEIFSGRPPKLVFEDETFDLDNISARGAGCISRKRQDDNPYAAPGSKGVLRLTQSGRELFLGAARKARHMAGPGGISAGFELEENNFDLDWLIRENASILARVDKTRAEAPQPSTEYKTFCADASAFIGGYLQRIQQFVAPIEPTIGENERNEIARDLANSAEAEWLDILQEGNALTAAIHADKQQRIGYKTYTERTVTQMLLAGPGWARCLFKPAGYPGDYKIMNYGYEQKPEGERVAEKFLHLLGMIASRAIITRMEMVATLIADHALRQTDSGKRELSITSVGCGPARELEDLLEATPDNVTWRVTLVDQEPAALDYAFDRVAGLKDRDRISLTGLNISFREMLRPTPENAAFANNDVIYSSGFVDYLNPLLAQRFVKRLYDFVRPGGKVIVGNVNNRATGMIWPLEYITDWSLYFRNEDEMRAMAREIPGAIVSVVPDPMDAVYFLVVEKPVA